MKSRRQERGRRRFGASKRGVPRLVVLLTALLFAAPPVSAESIRVSAAISLKEAITDIAKKFEVDTHDHVDLIFGASGNLAAQITNGAPVDVFISAANKEVDDLSRAGLVDDATRRVVAGNDLVLIVPPDSKIGLTRFDQLAGPEVGKVSIGEPKVVPAGQYAMQVLTALKLDRALGDRLIYGSNVRQVLAYVERGEVSAGIVYKTDAIQADSKVKVVAIANPSTHASIVLPAVVIKASAKKALGVKLIEYILSNQGQSILVAHGFVRGSDAAPATAPSS